MKKFIKVAALPLLLVLVLFACKKDVNSPAVQDEIAPEVLAKIKEMGLSTMGVAKIKDGYLVEGDIVITEQNLENPIKFTSQRSGETEHYYTSLLCLPRTITISLNASLPARYVTMVDGAIARYNAEGLSINFVRVASGGNIVVNPAPAGAGYLASAGFPVSCNPYSQILVNRAYLDTWNINTCITIITHEVGHCIGFRHTDWQNRSYSGCAPPYVEQANPPGANHIPGTPTTPNGDLNSFMMACIGNGANRPFTAFDRVALNWLF